MSAASVLDQALLDETAGRDVVFQDVQGGLCTAVCVDGPFERWMAEVAASIRHNIWNVARPDVFVVSSFNNISVDVPSGEKIYPSVVLC